MSITFQALPLILVAHGAHVFAFAFVMLSSQCDALGVGSSWSLGVSFRRGCLPSMGCLVKTYFSHVLPLQEVSPLLGIPFLNFEFPRC